MPSTRCTRSSAGCRRRVAPVDELVGLAELDVVVVVRRQDRPALDRHHVHIERLRAAVVAAVELGQHGLLGLARRYMSARKSALWLSQSPLGPSMSMFAGVTIRTFGRGRVPHSRDGDGHKGAPGEQDGREPSCRQASHACLRACRKVYARAQTRYTGADPGAAGHRQRGWSSKTARPSAASDRIVEIDPVDDADERSGRTGCRARPGRGRRGRTRPAGRGPARSRVTSSVRPRTVIVAPPAARRLRTQLTSPHGAQTQRLPEYSMIATASCAAGRSSGRGS